MGLQSTLGQLTVANELAEGSPVALQLKMGAMRGKPNNFHWNFGITRTKPVNLQFNA